jgi:hypothetical protein
MTYQLTAIDDDSITLPKLPGWVTSGRAETLETVAFQSGAALLVLNQLLSDPIHGVPVKLLGNRLALKVATSTSKLEGRLARETDIRDAYHLTPPGEARGPDGDLLAFWREAARLRLTGRDRQAGCADLIGSNLGAEVEGWLKASTARGKTHRPLAGCVFVMRLVLEADDRAERVACLLSDVVLARAPKWPMVLPASALHVTKAMLRGLVGGGQGGELPVQQRFLQSVEETIRLARDLAQRGGGTSSGCPKAQDQGIGRGGRAIFV